MLAFLLLGVGRVFRDFVSGRGALEFSYYSEDVGSVGG